MCQIGSLSLSRALAEMAGSQQVASSTAVCTMQVPFENTDESFHAAFTSVSSDSNANTHYELEKFVNTPALETAYLSNFAKTSENNGDLRSMRQLLELSVQIHTSWQILPRAARMMYDLRIYDSRPSWSSQSPRV